MPPNFRLAVVAERLLVLIDLEARLVRGDVGGEGAFIRAFLLGWGMAVA